MLKTNAGRATTSCAQVNQQTRRSLRDLFFKNRASEILLAGRDDIMYQEVLNVGLEATNSECGILGYIDQKRDLKCLAMIGDTWNRYRVSDKDIVFPRERWNGIWGQAMTEMKTLYSNKLFPKAKGHPALLRVLAVPIINQGTLIGVFVVGNKKTDYYNDDQVILETISSMMSQILHAKVQHHKEDAERILLELQLRQAQRMEAVGRLAGSVAHDFNNSLMVILGNTDIMMGSLSEGDPIYRNAEEIKKAGESAAALTRRLLVFSRKPVLQTMTLDLNSVLLGLEKMLRLLLGEAIELITRLNPALGCVEADPGLIEQLVMNLAVNARDAMPHRGQLTIETANVDLGDDTTYGLTDVLPGPYTMLTVNDTGSGMSKEVQSKMFEPFYTTKETVRGTGLGLSSVDGIVKQCNGHIWVHSEPGLGTTFKIFLPRVEEKPVSVQDTELPANTFVGSETILVVDDNDDVRGLIRDILSHYGYNILEANNGRTALEINARYEKPIHLVVTDLMMPGIFGPELARSIQSRRPAIKVVYISGYLELVGLNLGEVLDPEVAFLQKPFLPETLAQKVRMVLDAPAGKVDERCTPPATLDRSRNPHPKGGVMGTG